MPSFFFKDAAPTEISSLPLHAALPISATGRAGARQRAARADSAQGHGLQAGQARSEEHTSELQSQSNLLCRLFFLRMRRPPRSPLFPYTPLFRSQQLVEPERGNEQLELIPRKATGFRPGKRDRKSTRLNSSHSQISYAVFFF